MLAASSFEIPSLMVPGSDEVLGFLEPRDELTSRTAFDDVDLVRAGLLEDDGDVRPRAQNLVKALEPVRVRRDDGRPARPQTPTRPGRRRVEEQDGVTVVLKESGANKINVIKAVREVNSSLGLKEAKDLVENLGTIKEGISKDEAASIKKKVRGRRSQVEVK